MSRRTIVILTDDLDDRTPAVTTRTFALDDKVYEVDLSDPSSAHLEDVLAEFIKGGRVVEALHPEQSLRDDAGDLGGLSLREYNKRMRAWAESVGRGDEITGKHNGAFYYPKAIKADYAEHLRWLALQLTADQGSS